MTTSAGASPCSARAVSGVRPAVSTTTRSGCGQAGDATGVEQRVVGEHGADPGHDRVGLGAQPVHVGARRLTGDPAGRAVGGGAAAVERRGVLPGDERAAGAAAGEPGLERSGGDLVGQHAGLDVDPGRRAARRRRRRPAAVGSAHATTTRATPASSSADVHGPVRPVCRHGSSVTTAVPPRARSPRLRQRDDLRVRAAGRRRPALADDLALGVEDHRADRRVGRGARRARHATARRRGASRRALPSWPSGPLARSGALRGRAVTGPTPRSRVEPDRPCAPLLRTLTVGPGVHRVHRWLAASGSRTVTAGQESPRHLPRSALLSPMSPATAGAAPSGRRGRAQHREPVVADGLAVLLDLLRRGVDARLTRRSPPAALGRGRRWARRCRRRGGARRVRSWRAPVPGRAPCPMHRDRYAGAVRHCLADGRPARPAAHCVRRPGGAAARPRRRTRRCGPPAARAGPCSTWRSTSSSTPAAGWWPRRRRPTGRPTSDAVRYWADWGGSRATRPTTTCGGRA